jgi:hypothetical protein
MNNNFFLLSPKNVNKNVVIPEKNVDINMDISYILNKKMPLPNKFLLLFNNERQIFRYTL